MHEPRISFIVVSRNDDHGGDMLKRMRIFVRGLIHQCDAFRLPCELVMVEWNPPANRPPLRDVLPAPSADSFLRIRYIRVPGELHHTLKNADIIPLFQMIGKNVGIRRAHAEWVLCTNVDLLFEDGIFRFFRGGNISHDTFIRANRCDIPSTLDENLSFPQQLEFSRHNILKRLGKNPAYPNLEKTGAFIFSNAHLQFIPPMLSKWKRMRSDDFSDTLASLDTDACGDFTMMTKKAWMEIEGYLELEIYSIHIDSLALYAAAARGLKQHIQHPESCTYHIHHKSGWDFANPLERVKFSFSKPMLDWGTAKEMGEYVLKNRIPYGINRPDWGFAGEKFEEVVV